MAPWVLAIDFGTSSSCAAVWADGRAQELRVDGDVRVPSTVVLDEQGKVESVFPPANSDCDGA